jgi:uncharacterized protein (TIGR02231 family)
MKKLVLGAFMLTTSLTGLGVNAALADEINGQSRISSVMVFPNGAQVTRVISVDLPAGKHQLSVKDLPSDLQARSLRIEGAGDGPIEIGSVDQRVVTEALNSATDNSARELLMQQLQTLRDERELTNSIIQAAELQKKLLNEMALLPSRPIGRNEQGGTDVVTQYSNLYNLMGDKFLETQAKALKAKVQLRDLDKRIKNIRAQIAERPNKRKRRTHLTVNVEAEKPGKARFVVHYQIRGASWAPLYDARLQTADGKTKANLNLVRRAVIRQTTSEDWTNVKLRLSTTNPTGRTKAPDLFAWLIDFKKKRRPVPVPMAMQEMDQSYGGQKKHRGKINMRHDRQTGLLNMKAPAKPRMAKVNSGQFQMTFDVANKTTIKRDGTRKKVFLDALSLTPDVQLFAVPKRTQKAFLHASFVNKTGNALIPGPVSLFRDGVYVGQSRLALVEPDQKLDIGFGVDSKVNVKWVRQNRVKGKTGLLTTSNSDVRKYKVTLVSGHKTPMKMTVLDQMPYSEKETLQVSLLTASPKPTRTNVDDKRGVMAWDVTLAPQKAKVIEFGYQVVWPKDKAITLR